MGDSFEYRYDFGDGWLLGFGLVHATLIWHGDILVDYALAGFALVLFRNWAPRRLLFAAAALWLLYPYVLVHLAAVLSITLPSYGPWRELNQQALQAYAHGTWLQTKVYGAAQFFGWLYRSLLLGGSASFLACSFSDSAPSAWIWSHV